MIQIHYPKILKIPIGTFANFQINELTFHYCLFPAKAIANLVYLRKFALLEIKN